MNTNSCGRVDDWNDCGVVATREDDQVGRSRVEKWDRDDHDDRDNWCGCRCHRRHNCCCHNDRDNDDDHNNCRESCFCRGVRRVFGSRCR